MFHLVGIGGRFEFRVRFGDTDCTGRVYFPVYVRWIDDAITELLRGRGVSYDASGGLIIDDVKLDEIFVLGEYRCRIKKPSRLDDVIVVDIKMKEVRNKVVVFKGNLFNRITGDELASGQITYICVDKSGKSTEIPKRLLEVLK
ncbi:MAG: acyl-CoA thioesterase YbgC [Candidatus Bathyarchaeota archaeon BA1]|nr:MAG: acyl-CoA thioesterase YbgC [Candidatus Bathyarchaeota archaeon BA1]